MKNLKAIAILLDSITFFVSVFIFALIKLDSENISHNITNSFFKDVIAGFKFVVTYGFPILLHLLLEFPLV